MGETPLVKKIKEIPAAYLQEVEDFIDTILKKERETPQRERKIGLLKGKMKMSADFDAPIADFKDYM